MNPITANLTPAQVGARLDRLPFSRFHRRFLALIALGAWFDLYDNVVAGSLVVSLTAAGVLDSQQTYGWITQDGLFMASLSLGMFLGTMVFGLASDYVGRRVGFIAMLLLYSGATLLGGVGYYPVAAVAGSAVGLGLLFFTRLAAGAGIGAENVVIDAYVAELVPPQVRGRSQAIVQAVAFTAFPVAALLARLIVPSGHAERWWWLLVIGSLGALFSWYFRRRLPESPRWSALQGRTDEAAATLRKIETTVEQEVGPLPMPATPTEPPVVAHQPWRTIWSPQYRARTLMLVAFHMLQTVSYYGFMHWIPTYFRAKGFNHDNALTMQLGSAFLAPVGPLLGMWASEQWQRKRLIVAIALTLAVLQITFGTLDDAIGLTAVGALIVLCLNGFSAVFHAYQAELFPTEARATGIGFTYAWSRASMVVTSLLVPPLLKEWPQAPYLLMAGAMLGVAGVIGAFGPLTNERALEEVSPAADTLPARPPKPGAA